MGANPNPVGELRDVRDSCKWSARVQIQNQESAHKNSVRHRLRKSARGRIESANARERFFVAIDALTQSRARTRSRVFRVE
jgi:hypothetical protein